MNLGELEQLVLLALVRLGDDAYGVSVFETIERHGRRGLALGAVYRALTRLEEKGMVSSSVGEPTPVRGGRRRRCYRIEAAGRRALDESIGAIRRLADGLDLGSAPR
ncbi:MAG: helix-turn-helix transcriptional regulator [Gemmatimonadales bacterium]